MTWTKGHNDVLFAISTGHTAHDIRYMLAQDLNDVRTADKKMINKLTQIKAKKQDADFNINQGLYGIKSKVMLEDMNSQNTCFLNSKVLHMLSLLSVNLYKIISIYYKPSIYNIY